MWMRVSLPLRNRSSSRLSGARVAPPGRGVVMRMGRRVTISPRTLIRSSPTVAVAARDWSSPPSACDIASAVPLREGNYLGLVGPREPAEESMEAAGTCEIARLPEELLSVALSLTTPPDACRAAAVSRAFRAAADSDAVWSRFLPRDLPPLAAGEFSPAASKKEMFLCLSDGPTLLADGLRIIWLDRRTAGKCHMLSARALKSCLGQYASALSLDPSY
ncbi:F-box protein SKIP3-like [Phragmites australis]|uniref:F-box protein SKIP3-like n=1 Tax=Phragmites australis TaxID=29695 RepID=UPI002D77BFAF|nr:F-box protein SKIP3-like [Phragmites australis]